MVVVGGVKEAYEAKVGKKVTKTTIYRSMASVSTRKPALKSRKSIT